MDAILNFLNALCMTFVGAAKAALDVYAQCVYGLTGAIGKLGTGLVVGGAITAGGWAAANATPPPAGPVLGQPPAQEAAAEPSSTQRFVNVVESPLPGAPV